MHNPVYEDVSKEPPAARPSREAVFSLQPAGGSLGRRSFVDIVVVILASKVLIPTARRPASVPACPLGPCPFTQVRMTTVGGDEVERLRARGK